MRVLICVCRLLTVVLLFAVSSLSAFAAYTDNGDGTVTDTRTGLTWMRCSMGQTWSNGTCNNPASTYTREAAWALTHSFAGQSDWRLPSNSELLSIVDSGRNNPSIDPTAFPATPSYRYWTSTPYLVDSTHAYSVYFINGTLEVDLISGQSYHVRLVRGASNLLSGLVGYWNFDNCTATDSSGNGNHGSLVGTPTCNGSAGKAGAGLLQNNLSQYINLGNNIAVGNAFSYSGWYRLSGTASTQWHSFFLSNSYCC